MTLGRTLRKAIFWAHLGVGAGAGLVLAVMAGTGVCLAFRPELTAWAERAVRQVKPTTAVTLSYSLLLDAVRDAKPEARPMLATLARDPRAAAQFVLGRDEVVFVDPYSGDVAGTDSPRVRTFFTQVEQLHRWLGLQGAARPFAQAVTSACCAGLLFLVASGLYLWWPRRSTWAALAATARLHFAHRGYARDRNWHEVVGFWLLPILLVSTGTGLVQAYPKVADRVLGARPAPPALGAPAAPGGKVKPLSVDRQIQAVATAYPTWDTLTVRSGKAPGAAAAAHRAEKRGAPPINGAPATPRSDPSFVVRLAGWPQRQLEVTVDPSGQVVVQSDSAQQSWLRALRTSARTIHTGEAGGPVGQALMALGALGALVLIFTGFSLLMRRVARTVARRRCLGAPAGADAGRT